MNLTEQIGPSAGCFWGTTIYDAVNRAAAMNFKTIEINCGLEYPDIAAPGIWPWDKDGEETLKKCCHNKFHLTGAHATFNDINFLAANPRIRNESQQQIKMTLEFASRLGCSWLVVHPGKNSCMLKEERLKDMCLENMKLFAEWGKANQVKVAIENVEYMRPLALKTLLGMLQKIDSEYLGMTLDIPRAMEPGIYGKWTYKDFNDMPSFIKAAGKFIFDIHIHEANQNYTRAHLPLIAENKDFYRQILGALDFINYKGAIILEVITDKYDDFDRSRAILMESYM